MASIDNNQTTFILKDELSPNKDPSGLSENDVKIFLFYLLNEEYYYKKGSEPYSSSEPNYWKTEGEVCLNIMSYTNGFVSAVYQAFAFHHPLELSPDHIWLTILQGFATHVNLNAEKLRKQFVDFEGKQKIEVDANVSLDNPNCNWGDVIELFIDQIGKYVPTEVTELVISTDKTDNSKKPLFSTTTSLASSAFGICFMDAMQQYFEYFGTTECGIPKITLLGSIDDWRKIYDLIGELEKYGLEDWVKHLKCIIKEFILVKEGNTPNLEFWNGIFKYYDPRGGSGSVPYVNGWIKFLFPYLDKNKKNPFSEYGIEPCNFPKGTRSCSVTWDFNGILLVGKNIYKIIYNLFYMILNNLF